MSAHAAPGISVISIIKLEHKMSRRDKVFCEGFLLCVWTKLHFLEIRQKLKGIFRQQVQEKCGIAEEI
jgi:hypothetical protein